MTTAPENLGRRERRKAETRDRLLDAGRALIVQGGTEAIKITTVTERADVGFGTFYTYFETKDALVAAVVSETMEHIATIIGTRAQESADPAEAVAISYRRFIAYANEQPEFAAVLLSMTDPEGTFEHALAPQARETIARGIASGRFDIADAELALTSVAAAALAAIRASLAGRLMPDAGINGAVMFLRAFGVPDAEAREIACRPMPDIAIDD